MKDTYLDRFGWYVFLLWLSLFVVLWVQFENGSSLFEGGLIAFCCILIIYPFTTYLSGGLLQKAVKNRQFFVFGLQFVAISLLVSLPLMGVFVLFDYLEEIGVFPRSIMFEGEDTALGDYIGPFASGILINFGFCGMRFFEENLKMQKTMIESQLQILQAQINPHFMFNVLNHVNVLIKKEPALASALLIQYTEILRYQLYTTKKDYVCIGQEVEFLKNFIEIEKVRWKNNLDVECSWKVEDDDYHIPPLLLITFIENAFKHVSRSKKKKGYVKIELKQDKEGVTLYVENSKFADSYQKNNKEDSGLGLSNIRKRLDILLPDKNNIVINDSETMYSTILLIKR